MLYIIEKNIFSLLTTYKLIGQEIRKLEANNHYLKELRLELSSTAQLTQVRTETVRDHTESEPEPIYHYS